MNDEDIEFIRQKYKWRFLWTDIFDKYFILIVPFFFIFLALMISYFALIRITDFTFLLVTIPIFLFGCLTFYFMFKRIENERKFRIIPFEKQILDFEKNFSNLGWELYSKTEKVIVGVTKISFFSWGETVTIILDNKELLFNSRPQGRQPFTFNRDKVNYKKFCNEITKP